MKNLFLRLEKWRWLILAVIGLALLWVEVQEFLALRILNQAFHYFEVFQYAVLLTSTGLLLELFARSSRAHKQALKILENKHRISLELAGQDDWESLIEKLAMIPARIMEVEEAYLLIRDPISGKFEAAGHWPREMPQQAQAKSWDPMFPCKRCLNRPSAVKPVFHVCEGGESPSGDYVYGLEASHQNIPTAILRFRVRPEAKLTRDKEEIFDSIRDEIILAIQVSQDRKRLSEMQSAEVAMSERRTVSTYVHDQLGQNLGYMHLKLDQLSANENGIRSKDFKNELNRLREVANESYEIVRDILKRLQSETIPHLTNLLHEHARVLSRRAKFAVEFKTVGNPTSLATDIQQIIFYTFREVLSNIERHSGADKVEILVAWKDGQLDISVADNGKGFDPEKVRKDEHFGLDIMQERISNIKGKLTIDSSADSGTNVSISIPLSSTKEVVA